MIQVWPLFFWNGWLNHQLVVTSMMSSVKQDWLVGVFGYFSGGLDLATSAKKPLLFDKNQWFIPNVFPIHR